LTYWRRAAREINYRRFFNIDELVALRAEREWVFEETHSLILDMVGTALVDALRVDHVDGLRDPRGYLERLVRRAAERRGAPVPVWVEKILAEDERLREDWPTGGTTGYEALNELESLFVDPDGEHRLVAGYGKLLAGTRGARPFGSVAHGAKRLALATSLAADLGRLTTLLERWYAPERREGAVRRESLERAIAATIAALPVYRTYVRPGEPVHPDDRRWLESALASARSEAESEAVDVLEHALLPHEDAAEPDHELDRPRSRI